MKVLGGPTLKITPGISLDSSNGKGVTRSCISTPNQMGPWSYLSPDSWCGLTSCLLNISLTVTNSLVLFMLFTVINWDQLQKVWSIPANFSHVKCDWFSYPCLTETAWQLWNSSEDITTSSQHYRRCSDDFRKSPNAALRSLQSRWPSCRDHVYLNTERRYRETLTYCLGLKRDT